MENKCVVAEYMNYAKARVGLEVLDMRGFTADDVSVVSRSSDSEVPELERARREKNLRPSAGVSTGIGAAVGAGVAAPIALGTLLAPLFLVGPIAAAVAGAASGTLLSGAKNWGIDEDTSRSYQQRIEEGSVLVIVHATGDRLLEAEGGLRTTDTLSLEGYGTDVA